MNDVIVYLWADVYEMSESLEPEFWDTVAKPARIHVSLKNPTEGTDDEEDISEELMAGESRDFILLKRKIYLLPTGLILRDHVIFYEGDPCLLKWDAKKELVCAKNQYGEFYLVPSD